MNLRVALGVAVGGLLLWLLLRSVPLDQVGAALAKARPLPLIAAGLAFVGEQAIRGRRQQVLVERLVPGVGFRSQFGIQCVGTFFVNTLPARLGEVVRPMLLRQRCGLALGSGFGVVVTERAFDLVALAAVLLAVFALADLPPVPIEFFGRTGDAVAATRAGALWILLPGLLALFGLAVFGERAVAGVERRVGTEEAGASGARRLLLLGLAFARTFVAGLQSVREPRPMARVAGLTAASFATTGVIAVLLGVALGLEEHVDYLAGLGVQAIATLGMMLPAPPAFVGVFEASVVASLALFGVRGPGLDALALAFAVALHGGLYSIQGVLCLAFVWRDGLRPVAALRASSERVT